MRHLSNTTEQQPAAGLQRHIPQTGELPCQTREPELWFAEDPRDVELAKTLCRGCPVRQSCLAGAMRRQEDFGIWGGEIFWHGVVVATRPRRGRPRKSAPDMSGGAERSVRIA